MYGTIEAWRTYSFDRGDSAPTDASNDEATAALTRASDYVKYSYVQHFLSRYDDTLPVVADATYEAANLELATPGFFSKTYTPDQQKVLTKVGDLSWTPIGSADGAEAARPVSTRVDAMLSPMTGKNIGIGMLSVGLNP